MPKNSPGSTSSPVSSRSSRRRQSSGCSCSSRKPPGMSQRPRYGSCARRPSRSRPRSSTRSAHAVGAGFAYMTKPHAVQSTRPSACASSAPHRGQIRHPSRIATIKRPYRGSAMTENPEPSEHEEELADTERHQDEEAMRGAEHHDPPRQDEEG